MTAQDFIKAYRIDNPSKFQLAHMETRPRFFSKSKDARAIRDQNAASIAPLVHRLYGEAKRSLLIVLQGMDTSGKDGTTEACFKNTPPLNINVAAFKAPNKTELTHDYLWRIHNACPPKGHITIFNRSHYEDVLVVKVRSLVPGQQVEQRYEQINNFEKHLSENGTKIIKFMLHISHEVQGERLQERLIMPHKLWKFNPGDLDDRALWPDFMHAYETMIQRTSTPWAPWHVIPSDSRSRRGAIISTIIRKTLEDMNPQYPNPGFNPDDYNI